MIVDGGYKLFLKRNRDRKDDDDIGGGNSICQNKTKREVYESRKFWKRINNK